MTRFILPLFASILLTPPDGCGRLREEIGAKQVWEIEAPSVRALEVVSEEEIWYAGAQGHMGYTLDAGVTWNQLKISDRSFRSLAVTDSAVHALTIESPALLLRSTDRFATWDTVFVDADSSAFYDSMVFWDAAEGIAMGDPIEDCLRIIVTRDGGKSWSIIPCEELPKTLEGEAGFAASNTNIAVHGNDVWVASGGAAARLFHSADRGRTWHVQDTPMNQGGQMTGTFGMAVSQDGKHGVLVGGDWGDKDNQEGATAWTRNGGRSWESGQGLGYRSCVQFDPRNPRTVMAVGTPGVSRSVDGGRSWSEWSADTTFYTTRFSPSGESLWLAGRGVIARFHPMPE